MLDEDEWLVFEPALHACLQAIKDYREEHGVSLPETPVAALYDAAVDEYERLTGYRECDPVSLWHHRRSMHGPPCKACGKPLRTLRATTCAACGARSETV